MSTSDRTQQMSLIKYAGRAALGTPLNPRDEQIKVDELKKNSGTVTSEAADAEFPSSRTLKWIYLGFGLTGFLLGISLLSAAFAQKMVFNVNLGSDVLPNMGTLYTAWNLNALCSVGFTAIFLFYIIVLVGPLWNSAVVGIFAQHTPGTRALLDLFLLPLIYWVTLQWVDVTNVFIIIGVIMSRLGAMVVELLQDRYNSSWTKAMLDENSAADGEVDYWYHGIFMALILRAWPIIVVIFYLVETWTVIKAPAATAQVIVPAIYDHFVVFAITGISIPALDLLAYVLWALKHYPDYTPGSGDNSYLNSAFQGLRQPVIQEGVQFVIRMLMSYWLLVGMFIAMYTVADVH
jgi:hypothetical protein